MISKANAFIYYRAFNDYLCPLVNVEGAMSISTILLVDVDTRSYLKGSRCTRGG
jgi:hypothetical protein